MSRRLRVLVLFGGRSSEHWVSSVSARHVAAALDPERFEVIPVGITMTGRWMLPDPSRKALEGGPLEIPAEAFEAAGEPVSMVGDPTRREIAPLANPAPFESIGDIDVVFPVLHGPYGEDGTVQGLLEMTDLPYVGAGVLGSALGMDKEKMKVVFRASGLPVGRFEIVRRASWEADRAAALVRASSLGFPCFTKPANLGSSVGIRKCHEWEELEAGIIEALRYDRKVMIEEMLAGREIECSVLGNDEPRASACGEVIPGREFYDYEAKYFDDSSKTIIPADLPKVVSEEIRKLAIEAFQAIDASGMARVDFFYDAGGRGIVLNEINTIPGFTPISMYPKLWAASGLPYPQLIERLIELAFERYENKPRPEDTGSPVR